MVIVNIGASAAACAVAAVVIGNPIGAAGGAIYGAVFGAVGSVTEEVGRTSSIGVKTLLVIGAVFAAWQLAELCGVTMSFGSAVVSSSRGGTYEYAGSRLLDCISLGGFF